MAIEIKKEFNDIGEKITIQINHEMQLKYEDMEISELPENCYKCPVGFMNNNCGREIPLNAEGRPNTCRLRLAYIPGSNFKDIIKGLEICYSEGNKKQIESCNSCPYVSYAFWGENYKGTSCEEELMKDLLRLLGIEIKE